MGIQDLGLASVHKELVAHLATIEDMHARPFTIYPIIKKIPVNKVSNI